MNGPHDLGGAHGFGAVVIEPNEPVFHADWERATFALTILMGPTGLWSLDRSRFVRECLPHTDYYSLSYYGIWLAALERLVADADVAGSPKPPRRVLAKADVRAAMGGGFPATRAGPQARFKVGDTVRVKAMNPATHVRAPRYVRGHMGQIAALRGTHVLPDTSAHNQGDNPTPLYNVSFEGAALWGPDTTASHVNVDLFENYLERV